jgi:hypothetical protein
MNLRTISDIKDKVRECSAALNQIGHEAHDLGQDEYASQVAELRDQLVDIEEALDDLHPDE